MCCSLNGDGEALTICEGRAIIDAYNRHTDHFLEILSCSFQMQDSETLFCC